MRDLEWFKGHEAGFRKFLEGVILKKNAEFREAANNILSESRPIRSPGGRSMPRHDREWFWRDAFWCQDFGLDEAADFFSDLNTEDGPTHEEMEEILEEGGGTEDGIYDWFIETTNSVFREVIPELAHVLDA